MSVRFTSLDVPLAEPDFLTEALTRSLNAPLTLTFVSNTNENRTVTKNHTLIEERDCPPGFWCTAGKAVPCPRNTYNPDVGKYLQTACLNCPPSALSHENSSSINQCVCQKHFYQEDHMPIDSNGTHYVNAFTGEPEANAFTCKACPIGTNCLFEGQLWITYR